MVGGGGDARRGINNQLNAAIQDCAAHMAVYCSFHKSLLSLAFMSMQNLCISEWSTSVRAVTQIFWRNGNASLTYFCTLAMEALVVSESFT